jgi:hypothetical protein
MPRGYQRATGDELLAWPRMAERLERATTYWLATTRPDGRPHVTPVWGVWVDGALYFDGIPTALWARNLAANRGVAVHLESGTDVLIVEGDADDLTTDAVLGDRIASAWGEKYGRLVPAPAASGIFRLRPTTARGWSHFPHDATRWSFADA